VPAPDPCRLASVAAKNQSHMIVTFVRAVQPRQKRKQHKEGRERNGGVRTVMGCMRTVAHQRPYLLFQVPYLKSPLL
jgi:hypothetical protein